MMEISNRWILNILSIFFIILLFLPIIPLLAWSVSDGWTWPDLFPNEITLKGFQYVLSPLSGSFHALMNTWLIAGLTALINIVIAIPAADAIARYDYKGKRWIEIFLILPILVPPIVIVLGLHRLFLQIYLVDTFIGVVLVHVIPTLPYMIRTITSSYRNVSFQMEDQAKMLGANSIKRFCHIVLPQILPGIIAGTGLTFLISMSQYIITIIIGGGKVVTLTMLFFPFINGGDLRIGAAYSIIFAVCALGTLILLDATLYKNIIDFSKKR